MELTFEFWYLFPISILIATIAMSSGIGGAVFFAPLFMIGLKLDPTVAVGTALATELFGFGSGLYAYVKAKLIDYKLGKNLLLYSIPAAILGTVYGNLIPGDILKTIFAVGIIFIGYQLFVSWRQEEREKKEKERKAEFELIHESELTGEDGTVYKYTVCNRGMGRFFAVIGGAFVGMISVGLAELQEFQLVARCRVPAPVAIATSVFVVVITVLIASVGHFYEFFTHAKDQEINEVLNIVVFSIPGVVVGGQLGPRLQKVLPADKAKIGVAVLFVLVGGFMLYTLMG